MGFRELAKARYSVSKFSDKPIEKEKLDLVLEAAQLAPTASNLQPQRILVLDNEVYLEKVKKCTPDHFNAPTVLLICYDNTISWKHPYDKKDIGVADASIAASQIMLQAAELGLGTTSVAYFCPVLTVREFSLPENIVPVLMLPIGYPAKDSVPNDNHNKRLPLNETVFYNDYYNKK